MLPTQSREIWLDGLRGGAAFIVAWFHATNDYMLVQRRSFWDEPASKNRRLIQLAPFRLIFAGNAMVTIFFVVSGHSISTGLIKRRNDGSMIDFYQKLASSVFRRMFRLCLPVIAMFLISHILFYCGFYYSEAFGKVEGCPAADAWGNPIPHLECLLRTVWVNLQLQTSQFPTLNGHFWTIPVEVRGSFRVYLALLGLSRVSETARILAVSSFILSCLWNAEPEFLAFFVGLLFAELDATALRRQHSKLQLLSTDHLEIQARLRSSRRLRDRITTFTYYCVFALSLYLLSLPIPEWREGGFNTTFPPDWFFLKIFPPLPWWSTECTMRMWQTAGTVLGIISIRALPRLKKPLESDVAQYLGYISYSLYLCHPTVYRIMLERLLHWTSMHVSGVNYWTLYDREGYASLAIVWVVSMSITGPVVWLMSKYMAKYVDQKSIGISFRAEKLLSQL